MIMNNKRRIKLPGGKSVIKRPDKLRLKLVENLPLIEAQDYDSSYRILDSQHKASPAQNNYSNESFDIDKLTGYEITILGAGSIGSFIAWFLAAAQLILNIVDFKKVEHRHTTGGRTAYEPTSIGKYKVIALKQKIERDHPGTIINPLPYNVADIPDPALRSLFGRSAIVILAIDDPVQFLRAADLAYPLVEFIQVALHRGAKTAHVIISVPFVTPCLRCTLNIDSANDIHRLDSESANSFDIVATSQLASKIAVDIMYSKATGKDITRWDTSKNLIYIANQKGELSPDGPGLIFESSSRRQNCSICSKL